MENKIKLIRDKDADLMYFLLNVIVDYNLRGIKPTIDEIMVIAYFTEHGYTKDDLYEFIHQCCGGLIMPHGGDECIENKTFQYSFREVVSPLSIGYNDNLTNHIEISMNKLQAVNNEN